MSETLTPAPAIKEAGQVRTIRQDELEAVTVRDGNETTVWSEQVPADKIYAHGAGGSNRNVGRVVFGYCSLVDDAGNDIEGQLVAAITDSQQRRVLAETDYGDLSSLADAANEPRTERVKFPALDPVARRDRHIELRVEADPGSDGATLDPAASDLRLYYTDIDA